MCTHDDTGTSTNVFRREDAHWTERARRMVAYHRDAFDFIRRAPEHFPVSSEHVELVMRLWVDADDLDSLILPLLDALNVELLDGMAELDTTRGVSAQPPAFGALEGSDAEEVVYQCIWSLNWESGQGVSVALSVTSSGVFYMQARGSTSNREHRIGFPPTESALQEALTSAYVAEATSRPKGASIP